MNKLTVYLAGGMGKFGKDNFDEGNCWRVYCKKVLENYEGKYGIEIINPGLDEQNQTLHPWQVEMCARIFNNIDEMLDYVEDFYLS